MGKRPPLSVRSRLKHCVETRCVQRPRDEVFSDSGVDGVNPQPGAFKPVFNARKHVEHFSLEKVSIPDMYSTLGSALRDHEFGNLTEIPGYGRIEDVPAKIIEIAFLALAIRMAKVHSHMKYGDTYLSEFSDLPLPAVVSELVSMYGEFSGLTCWRLMDFESTVYSLLRAAADTARIGPYFANAHMWLPTKPNDLRTSHILSSHISKYLTKLGVKHNSADLFSAHAEGNVPPWFDSGENVPEGVDLRILKSVFFKYEREEEFYMNMSSQEARDCLAILGLEWNGRWVSELDFTCKWREYAERECGKWQVVAGLFERALNTRFTTSPDKAKMGSPLQFAEIEGEVWKLVTTSEPVDKADFVWLRQLARTSTVHLSSDFQFWKYAVSTKDLVMSMEEVTRSDMGC